MISDMGLDRVLWDIGWLLIGDGGLMMEEYCRANLP